MRTCQARFQKKWQSWGLVSSKFGAFIGNQDLSVGVQTQSKLHVLWVITLVLRAYVVNVEGISANATGTFAGSVPGSLMVLRIGLSQVRTFDPEGLPMPYLQIFDEKNSHSV